MSNIHFQRAFLAAVVLFVNVIIAGIFYDLYTTEDWNNNSVKTDCLVLEIKCRSSQVKVSYNQKVDNIEVYDVCGYQINKTYDCYYYQNEVRFEKYPDTNWKVVGLAFGVMDAFIIGIVVYACVALGNQQKIFELDEL